MSFARPDSQLSIDSKTEIPNQERKVDEVQIGGYVKVGRDC